ncbi:Elongation factor 1-alpha [Gryllus bimaculatus]|nr:Elongation factor 1-alpha [Gryllus bimaculatus]
MARHRNVRSMNYSDEYDGYDDVYGHSVEDEYCISPSDEAQFMYDRTRQPQISAFFSEQDNITEEDESLEQTNDRKNSDCFIRPTLSDLEEAKLRSCLEEIRNVIGDSISEKILVETVLKCDFNVNKSLDTILSNATSSNEIISEDPKPQRVRRERDRGARKCGVSADVEPNGKSSDEVAKETTATGKPPVKVVPPGAKTLNITKGFDVVNEKGDSAEVIENLRSSNAVTPRSQSPGSGRLSPNNPEGDSFDVEAGDKKAVKESGKTPRSRLHKTDALALYKQDRAQSKSHLHLVVIGHVDAGKSTLMGHLLYTLGQVNKKTMHKYEQESKKLGKQSFMYAWILDETGEERSRGITMDVGQSKFETHTKIVTLLDAPGHKDFIPNMITGATQADVAILVVDATRGEFETGFEMGGQTREHALLVRSLGVNQLGVVVNKLDTVGWNQDRFQEIVGKLGTFLRQAGFRESDVTFVPCSGLTGINLVNPPTEEKLLEWYKGPTLLDVIDNFRAPERPITKPFRLSVNDIFKGTGSGFCISGRVETGLVETGDKVLVQPQNEVAVIKAVTIDDAPTSIAYAGDQVSVTLSGIEMQNVSVGYILCDTTQPIPVTSRFEARIVVFNIKVPITKGFSVILHHQSLSEQAVITKLVAQLHKSSGEVVKRRPRCLVKNSNAVVELTTSRPVCLELYRDVKELGRFMLRVGGVTIAAGLVTQVVPCFRKC